MLIHFKNFLRQLETAPGGKNGYACRLTTAAYGSLVNLTRAVYGDTAAHVVRDSFTEDGNGYWIAGHDLVAAFADSLKGPT